MLERSTRYSVDMSSHLSSPTSLTKSRLYACPKLLAFAMIQTRLYYRTHFPVIINFCSHSAGEVRAEICPGMWNHVCIFVGMVSDHTTGKSVSSVPFLSVRKCKPTLPRWNCQDFSRLTSAEIWYQWKACLRNVLVEQIMYVCSTVAW
jgi:hypothetical protein